MQGIPPSQALRRKGYRLTPQRQMVLEVLQKANGHVRAEEICERVREQHPEVSESTVYRTLDLLLSLRLAMRTDLGGGEFSYHAASNGAHHHLVCCDCHQVFDVEESLLEPLREALLRRHGFEASLHHFAIFGRCAECAGKAGSDSAMN